MLVLGIGEGHAGSPPSGEELVQGEGLKVGVGGATGGGRKWGGGPGQPGQGGLLPSRAPVSAMD